MIPSSRFSCGSPSGLGIFPKSLSVSWCSTITCLGSRLLEPFLLLPLLFCSLTHTVRLWGQVYMEIHCWMMREASGPPKERTLTSGINHLFVVILIFLFY